MAIILDQAVRFRPHHKHFSCFANGEADFFDLLHKKSEQEMLVNEERANT